MTEQKSPRRILEPKEILKKKKKTNKAQKTIVYSYPVSVGSMYYGTGGNSGEGGSGEGGGGE